MDDTPDDGVADLTTSERTIRVMTFNVRVDVDDDLDERDWQTRKPLVASTIRFHRPDVIGLQEPNAAQFAYLREQLPDYDWEGVGRVDGDTEGEIMAVGYRPTRLACHTQGTFWLSETPDESGSVGWDARHPRTATWVDLEDRRTGARFFLFNTHFDHRGERARIESARLLRERIDSIAGDAPVVVTGDLNCVETDDPYTVLTAQAAPGRRLHDARYAARWPHHGSTVTFNRFEGATEKIDYVFVAGPTVEQHGVLAETWDGLVPSDHAPVVADVSLR